VKTETRSEEGGFVLVAVAAVLVALVGFVALGVDVGMLYSARTSAQRIADAAALAGAFTFISDPLTADHNGTATQHATQIATSNSILGVPVTDVTVVSDWNTRRVTVTVRSSQNTYFARALMPSNVPVAATAIAEASTRATGASGVKPFFIPNTAFAPPGTDACAACAASPNDVLIDGSGNKTAYAGSQIGQTFVLKTGNPSSAMGPGDFYALQFPGSSGGSDYRNNIGTSNPNPINCTTSYPVETGNMVGPTKQGVGDLIGNPVTDTYIAPGQYQLGNGTVSDLSKNLVLAPIWDPCTTAGFCPSGKFGGGGSVTLTVRAYALVFITSMTGNNVNARLINVTSCSGGGGGGGGAGDVGSSVLSVPLRLIRLP
jgi:Flp pilus assembly protein TadG